MYELVRALTQGSDHIRHDIPFLVMCCNSTITDLFLFVFTQLILHYHFSFSRIRLSLSKTYYRLSIIIYYTLYFSLSTHFIVFRYFLSKNQKNQSRKSQLVSLLMLIA